MDFAVNPQNLERVGLVELADFPHTHPHDWEQGDSIFRDAEILLKWQADLSEETKRFLMVQGLVHIWEAIQSQIDDLSD
jgi:hypothetical protein